ncbi:MAG: pitrilysin family protein, partial [Verrucomicrobiota bacterium]
MEDKGQEGLAHFVEHMAFNGTKNFKKLELVNYLESIGMRFGPDLNAYTSFDETVYMLQVPLKDSGHLDTAFKILRDWAQDVSFEDEEIEKERGVVLEEWRLGRGASRRIWDQQFPVLFHKSKYADRLPIGLPEVIEKGHPDLLRKFYKDWYRPDLMAIIAVGDADPKKIESMIKKTFGDIPKRENVRERVAFPVPDHDEALVSIVTDAEATRNSVGVFFKREVEPIKSRDDYRRLMKEMLFQTMFNQRLDEIRKQPDAPFLAAYGGKGSFVKTKSAFMLQALVKDGGVKNGLEAVLTEAERVRQFGFTASELERAKVARLRAVQVAHKERETTPSRNFASDYVTSFLEDTTEPGIDAELEMHETFLKTITIAELNQLARDWVSEDNRVVLASGPANPELKMPAKADLLALFDQVRKSKLEAWADDAGEGPLVPEELSSGKVNGKVAKRKKIKKLDAEVWTLSNGIKMILKKTDFKSDEVLFSAFSRGGHSLSRDAHFISAYSADGVMYESGLGNFSQVQLRKKLAGKVVTLNPYIQELQEGLDGRCSPEDL